MVSADHAEILLGLSRPNVDIWGFACFRAGDDVSCWIVAEIDDILFVLAVELLVVQRNRVEDDERAGSVDNVIVDNDEWSGHVFGPNSIRPANPAPVVLVVLRSEVDDFL